MLYKVGDKVIVSDRISEEVGEGDILHDKAAEILTIDSIRVEDGVTIYTIQEYQIDCLAADFEGVYDAEADVLAELEKEVAALLPDGLVVKIEESSEPYIDEDDDENPLNGSEMYFGYFEDLQGDMIEDSMTGYYCDPSSVRDDLVLAAEELDVHRQKNSLNTKRYAIVLDTEDKGTETLEDYDTAEQALAAFEAIRKNGYHIPENYSDIDKDKITFQNREFTTLTMDIEVWDEKMNHVGFEPIDHTPILMFNGRVISPVPEANKETMNFIRESAFERIPKLEKTIREIDEWKDGLRGMLVGSNTMICTLNDEGRIFHVVADSSLKVASEVDGHLTGVNMYSPDIAAKVARGITLHGEGAPGLTVQPVNMGVFQEEMRSRAENMLKSDNSLLKFFQIQDLASKAAPGSDLKSAVKLLNASKINTLHLK